ncbi:MAG TPA: DNA repair protein RecO, partial [Usitatibacter sp.]|nr:DNA repair protein RecO [Usitatibacter sp.]
MTLTDPGLDRGYVLHRYAYRETSLILQVWTEKHGRVGLVAKGARRPKSASRSLLVPFQPLALSWFGRGELRTLKSAEPAAAAATPLRGASLMSGFYLSELLLKLTHRDDPHEGLFAAYDAAIGELRSVSRALLSSPGELRERELGERTREAALAI